MKIAALQPGYLPWLGFFEQVYHVDLFVVYDMVSYSPRSWRNRNRIKTPNGPVYLTVPVIGGGPDFPLIRDVQVDNRHQWTRTHYGQVRYNYARAPFFSSYDPYFSELYSRSWDSLVELDMELIRFFVQELKIKTELVLASKAGVEESFQQSEGEKSVQNRAIFVCQFFGGDELYNGNAGKTLYSPQAFESHGIRLTFQEYQHPVYSQLHGEFVPYLSVIDLMMNHGPDSLSVLTGDKERSVA